MSTESLEMRFELIKGPFDRLSKIILILVGRNLAEVTVEEMNILLSTLRVSFPRNLTSLSNEGFCFSDLLCSFTMDHRYILLLCLRLLQRGNP